MGDEKGEHRTIVISVCTTCVCIQNSNVPRPPPPRQTAIHTLAPPPPHTYICHIDVSLTHLHPRRHDEGHEKEHDDDGGHVALGPRL